MVPVDDAIGYPVGVQLSMLSSMQYEAGEPMKLPPSSPNARENPMSTHKQEVIPMEMKHCMMIVSTLILLTSPP